jgi:hypothetical protein
MHQQSTPKYSSGGAESNISTGMRWLRGLLLLLIFSLTLSTIAPIVIFSVASGAVSLSPAVRLLRVLEGALASFAVDEEPAIVTCVPFGHPGWLDLRRTIVTLCLVSLVVVLTLIVVRHLECGREGGFAGGIEWDGRRLCAVIALRLLYAFRDDSAWRWVCRRTTKEAESKHRKMKSRVKVRKGDSLGKRSA